MDDIQPLNLLLEQRKRHWLMHCRFVLERLLMPLCHEGHIKSTTPAQRAVVVIDNRVDEQWLFTVLNTWLMCPTDSEFVLVADQNSVGKAENLLRQHAPSLNARVLDVVQLIPGVLMTEPASLNDMLKQPEFWRHMPHEALLIIQTDALLGRPLDPFSFSSPIWERHFCQGNTVNTLRSAGVTAVSAASSKQTLPSMALPIQRYIHICTAMAACRSDSEM